MKIDWPAVLLGWVVGIGGQIVVPDIAWWIWALLGGVATVLYMVVMDLFGW